MLVLAWAKRRDPETLQYLLDAGADIGAVNGRGETVIMRFATLMGSVSRTTYSEAQDDYTAFKILIEAGADIHARDNTGQTLLHHFASSFHVMVHRASDDDKQKHFFLATRKSMLLCLEHLVRLGADPEVADLGGKKPADRLLWNPSDCKEYLGSHLATFFGVDEGG